MTPSVLVGVGGCLGAVSRYQIAKLVIKLFGPTKFPVAICGINVLGCFVAGVLGVFLLKSDLAARDLSLFLLTGLLGGFTTFSAFGYETVELLRRGEVAVACSYVLLSVFLGLGAAFLGIYLGQRIF